MIRRFATPLLVVGCLVALVLACFGAALFRDGQFGYRDAAHFYYPLYQRVQQEWGAKRWPLWEPEENGGMPLMGNPTAAVLYPGKLIYAVLPYAWGARLYVVAHTLLAFGAMTALLRSWKLSWVGSSLGGLSYAFGGPILFQYCNIIYLVGAAWVPLGIRAVDGWIRLGRRFAILELAVILAMETLGGDPECAYLTGLCAAGYAVALARGRSRADSQSTEFTSGYRSRPPFLIPAAVVLLAIAWVVGTVAVAAWAPQVRPNRFPPVALPWMPYVAPTVAGLWGLAGVYLLNRWRRARAVPGGRPVFVPMLAGLVLAAVLAGAVSAAQLFPVLEFTGQSARAAGEGPHDIYPFSLQPWRLVEFLWPNLFGTPFHGNRSWLSVLPPTARTVKIWVPTLYIGGLTVVLALGAFRLRGESRAPWRSWMSVIAVVSLLGAFGEFTSPLFYARYFSGLAAVVGPHDASDAASIRFDHYLRDGDGSIYWFLATVLPGFRQFRFPCKLLTFTVLAVAALAGQGWDDLQRGDRGQRRRSVGWASALLALTLVAFAAAMITRSDLTEWLTAKKLASSFGPLEATAAVGEMIRGLFQGAVVLAIALVLGLKADRRPALAAAVALTALTADLTAANAKYVLTVPQTVLDKTPEVLQIIQKLEEKNPSPGPYRIHRMPVWNPRVWALEASDNRVRDFVEWERGTLQPKYGIAEGVHFTLTFGVAELYDYEWFFGGFNFTVRSQVLQALGAKQGKIIVFPRRSFDFWTTRYFVLPYNANNWTDETRAFASFLDQTELVYPPPDAFTGPDGEEKEFAWRSNHDYQIRRNKDVYPRGWVVHAARWLNPIVGLSRKDRERQLEEIMFSNDALWNDPNRTLYDARQIVWLDQADRPALANYLRNAAPGPDEHVEVLRYESDRMELEAVLDSPGIVVLAEVYYPGWTLTIDGKPAPIYRANRMMRGAAVPAGRHRLVYEFRPRIFRIGLWVSAAGLAVLAILAAWFVRRPLDPTLAPSPATPTLEGVRDRRGELP